MGVLTGLVVCQKGVRSGEAEPKTTAAAWERTPASGRPRAGAVLLPRWPPRVSLPRTVGPSGFDRGQG